MIDTVHHILRSRQWGFQFLDWGGYAPEERLWVPARHIIDTQLIRDFHRQQAVLPISASSITGGTCT